MFKLMKRIKKSVLFVSLFVLVLNLLGCSVKKKEIDDINGESSIGEISDIYMRQALINEEKEQPINITRSDDGGIFVVTGDELSSENVWYVDENDNWEKKYDLKALLETEDDINCSVCVTQNGDVFAQKGKEFFIIDKEGKKRNIELVLPELKKNEHHEENEITENYVQFAKNIDNYIYAVDANYNIFEINKTDYTSKMVFENTEFDYIDDFYIYDRTIILWYDEIICYEGIDTHDNEEQMYNRFKTYFENAKKNGKPIGMDVDAGRLWSVSDDMIYTINLENNSIAQSKVMGTKQNEFIREQVTINSVIYAIIYDISSMEYKLFKYLPTDESATVTDAEKRQMKIWTLETSQGFDEAVRCFTDKYPNVSVAVEIGLGEYGSGITVTDAIKNLNTELLSGDGPDIIYFDGVNTQKYIESEQLYDMTALVDELKNTGDYFNNILDAFNEDGKIYVVPSGASFLAKIGNNQNLEASRDINRFVEYIENNENEHNVISENQINHYIINEYYKNIKEELSEGSLDRDKLMNFYSSAKKLYELQGNDDLNLSLFAMIDPSIYASTYDGKFDFALVNITSVMSGMYLCKDMVEQINGKMEIPAEGYEKKYVPRGCVAISANSSNIDMAKEYIKIALGEECQGMIGGTVGLQVNQRAYKNYAENNYKMMSNGKNDEENEKLFYSQVTDIENVLKTLENPFCIDELFDQIIIDSLCDYIEGKIELDAAVDGTLDKIKIYLEE